MLLSADPPCVESAESADPPDAVVTNADVANADVANGGGLPASPDQLFGRLAALGIETTTLCHRPVFTVDEGRDLHALMPGGHCKTLLLDDRKGGLWLVVALGDTRLDLKGLHRRLGSGRLSFASAETLWRTLGVLPGSVTPFALINDRAQRVGVVLEAAMMESELLNYHPLENDRTTAIRPGDLLKFIAACGHRPQIIVLNAPGDVAQALR